MKLLPVLCSLFILSCTTFTDVNKPSTAFIPLSALLDSLHLQKPDISILIDKSDFTLKVMDGNTSIRVYKTVLGGNPIDQKLMEGDKCTPEGTFKVRNLYPHAKWSKFIWFDYPNEASVMNHEKAKENGVIPPSATLGGEVGIHGVPEGKDGLIAARINWTLGCVSLTTKDINDLYPVLEKGTIIHIQK